MSKICTGPQRNSKARDSEVGEQTMAAVHMTNFLGFLSESLPPTWGFLVQAAQHSPWLSSCETANTPRKTPRGSPLTLGEDPAAETLCQNVQTLPQQAVT